MKEVRKIIKPLADLLEYKIRSGEISYEGGDKVWRLALKHPEIVDSVMDLLDRELPEEELVRRVEQMI